MVYSQVTVEDGCPRFLEWALGHPTISFCDGFYGSRWQALQRHLAWEMVRRSVSRDIVSFLRLGTGSA